MSANIDQDFVEYVVKSLVGNPDAVSINRTIDEKGVLLELTVDPEDLGRVIGKRGGTAQSIRTLLRALGTKNDARYNLKIVDTDGGSGATRSQSSSDDNDSGAPTDSPQDDSAQSDDSPQTEEVQDEAPAQEDSEQTDDSGSEFEDTTSVEEPADNPVEEVESEPVDNESSDYAQKMRKDLADLDDLDI